MGRAPDLSSDLAEEPFAEPVVLEMRPACMQCLLKPTNPPIALDVNRSLRRTNSEGFECEKWPAMATSVALRQRNRGRAGLHSDVLAVQDAEGQSGHAELGGGSSSRPSLTYLL